LAKILSPFDKSHHHFFKSNSDLCTKLFKPVLFFFSQTDEKKALLDDNPDDNFNHSDLKPVKLEKTGSNSPISVHLSSSELLEACEASCVESGSGQISTSILPHNDVIKEECEPPKTPNTRLTNEELNPATTAVYIKDAQVSHVYFLHFK
jgi:hypothetical protein